jgi:hypothetical protein
VGRLVGGAGLARVGDGSGTTPNPSADLDPPRRRDLAFGSALTRIDSMQSTMLLFYSGALARRHEYPIRFGIGDSLFPGPVPPGSCPGVTGGPARIGRQSHTASGNFSGSLRPVVRLVSRQAAAKCRERAGSGGHANEVVVAGNGTGGRDQ